MNCILKSSCLTLLLLTFSSNIFAQDEVFWFHEEAPTPINLNEVKVAVGYPMKAVRKKVEGRVLVRILVDSTGNYVSDTTLTGPPILIKAVKKHIHKLRFNPAKIGGKNIAFYSTIPFEFKLEE